MKYFSEILKKTFDTEKECLKAEKEAEEKKIARQKDAEYLEELQREFINAYENYCNEVKRFIEKHGSYETTYKKTLPMPSPFLNKFYLTF